MWEQYIKVIAKSSSIQIVILVVYDDIINKLRKLCSDCGIKKNCLLFATYRTSAFIK